MGHICWRLVCLSWLVFLIPFPSKGSVVVPFSQTFSYAQYPGRHGEVVNHFLLKIAEGNNKLRIHTSYVFQGRLEMITERGLSGQCSLLLGYKDFAFDGDVRYKDFSLEKMLVPDLVSFTVEVISPDEERIFSQAYAGVGIPEQGTLVLEPLNKEWCFLAGYRMELTGLRFYYSDVIFERFEAWFASLQSYYEASALLNDIPGYLEELSFDDPEQLILDEFRLCEAEQMLSRARYALFYTWLHLENGDPENFLPRFNELTQMVDSLRHGFNKSLSQIDHLLFERSLVYKEEGNHERVEELCRRVLVYNPVHVPSHLVLAAYELERMELKGALARMKRVVSVMFPAVDRKEQADLLASEVLTAYFEEVEELIADNRFLEALRWLDDVVAFCQATTGLFLCPSELTELQSRSHQGMFRSYMLVSERAFRNDNLSFCLEYLTSAVAYQQEHVAFVPDRADADLLLNKLINRHRELGSTMQLHGDHEGAAVHLLAVKHICETFGFLNCSH